jgi:hypothetical protein
MKPNKGHLAPEAALVLLWSNSLSLSSRNLIILPGKKR